MKTTVFILFASAAMALSGCVKEKQPDNEVRFTGNLNKVVTRVGGSDGAEWTADDPVGIYMLKAEPGTLSAGNVQGANKRYTAASAGTTAAFTPCDGTPLYYPSDGSGAKFTAYHPYTASVNADFTVPFSVADQSDLSAIDLLHSPVTSASYSCANPLNVPLVFAHKLSKLVFVVSNGAGVSEPVANGISVAISEQKTAGTLDLASGAVAATGAAETLTVAAAVGAATIEAIVLPMADLAEVEFKFANNAGQVFVVSVPIATTPRWEGGKRYTYTVTLKAADKRADITGTISPWVDGGRTDVVAEQVSTNSRITWDGFRYDLTTDPTDAGLYFRFGSVVGLFTGDGTVATLPAGANGDTFEADDIAWNPTDATDWASLPLYAEYPARIDAAYHTAANVKAGKGDPCRLVGLDLEYIKETAAGALTAGDIDNGTWRLPTEAENRSFVGRKGSIDTSTHWTTVRGVAGGMFPNAASGSEDTFLPAVGYRNFDKGSVEDQGINAGYRSAAPYSNALGSNLYFIDNYFTPTNNGSTHSASAVRCVRQ